jgi:hypothetical protein
VFGDLVLLRLPYLLCCHRDRVVRTGPAVPLVKNGTCTPACVAVPAVGPVRVIPVAFAMLLLLGTLGIVGYLDACVV